MTLFTILMSRIFNFGPDGQFGLGNTLRLKEGVITPEEATNKSHICFNKMEIPRA